MARAEDPLLQPFSLKGRTFRNRVMSTAHACGLQKDGLPQDAYQAYHEEKARGGIGLSIFGGSSNVAPDSPNVFSQLNVGTDDVIPHLQRFSERMHRQGAALMCQITHLGRRGDAYGDNWLPMIAPSLIRETAHRAIPREMDAHDIKRVVASYAAAARRCAEGGLDGIETLASAHLIGQFLSPRTNQRTDGYGGALANRARFALEVHEAIREAVPADFIVGMRITVDEAVDGGMDAEECVRAAEMLKAAGAVDFFDALFGSMDTIRALSEETFPGIGDPLAPWVPAVGAFRRAVGLPVFHAARVSDLASARYAVAEGHVDMVGVTRAHMADPHLVSKLMHGQEDRVRPCVGAQHCQSQYRPHCLHNPATGRELTLSHRIAPASTPRKAIVVGAGPAGLEAARVLLERGHEVQVFEAADRAGGQLLLATEDPGRRDLIGIVDWRLAEIERLGGAITFNRFMEPADILALAPDLVVLATGGVPQTDFGPGADLVRSTWEIIGRETPLAGDVLVYDGTGRHPAPAVAKRALESGAKVSYVSIDSTVAQDLTYAEAVRWRKTFSALGLRPHGEMHLAAVTRAGNRLAATFVNDLTQQPITMEADQIVVDMGTLPMTELFEGLRPQSGNDGATDLDALIALMPQPRSAAGFELHRIGDALASRNVHAAIYDALRLCAVA